MDTKRSPISLALVLSKNSSKVLGYRNLLVNSAHIGPPIGSTSLTAAAINHNVWDVKPLSLIGIVIMLFPLTTHSVCSTYQSQ